MTYSQALEAQLRALDYWDTDASMDHTERLRQVLMHRTGRAPEAHDLHHSWGRDLQLADTYYVAPDICEMLVSVAATLPADAKLQPEMAPTHKGFVYLSRPLRVTWPGADNGVEWCAFTWGPYEEYPPDYEPPNWDRPDLSLIVKEGQDIVQFERRGSWIMPFGILGWPYGDPVDSWTGPDGVVSNSGDLSRRFILAFFAFVSQRILVTSTQRPERHLRRRLAREGVVHEPLIRVVELRRRQSRSDYRGESEPVAWSCRWPVSGHWRNQWYPSLNDHRPRWVMAYVKGPDSKPFKAPRAKVFAVTR